MNIDLELCQRDLQICIIVPFNPISPVNSLEKKIFLGRS